MNRTHLSYAAAMTMLFGSFTGCGGGEDAVLATFLVTEPSADGTVTVVAPGGSLGSGSTYSLANASLGVQSNGKSREDGGALTLFSAKSGDTLTVSFTSSGGEYKTEEVAPQEDLIAAHGLLTFSDPDNNPETGPNCMILIRDDVDPASGIPTELLLVPPPPCGCGGPPPGEGSSNQTPPPEKCTPPEGTPPPSGSGSSSSGGPPPGCKCPPPPQAGSTPPPEGSAPPPQCVPPGPPLHELVGTTITAVGFLVPPRGDEPCAGTPFAPQTIIPDDASVPVMTGVLEKVTVESGSSSVSCTVFTRTDLVDAEGQPVTDLLERFELVGGIAEELTTASEEGSEVSLTGMPFFGPTVCGFEAFEVTSYSVEDSTSAAQ